MADRRPHGDSGRRRRPGAANPAATPWGDGDDHHAARTFCSDDWQAVLSVSSNDSVVSASGGRARDILKYAFIRLNAWRGDRLEIETHSGQVTHVEYVSALVGRHSPPRPPVFR